MARSQKKSKPYKIEWFKFYDHSTSSEWVEDNDLDKDANPVIQVCGWVLHEDKKHIIVGNFMNGDTAA